MSFLSLKKRLLQNLLWLGNTNYNDRKANTPTKNNRIMTFKHSFICNALTMRIFSRSSHFDNLVILTATSEMP